MSDPDASFESTSSSEDLSFYNQVRDIIQPRTADEISVDDLLPGECVLHFKHELNDFGRVTKLNHDQSAVLEMSMKDCYKDNIMELNNRIYPKIGLFLHSDYSII